jgi:uncharacterized membrane protein
LRCLGRLSWYVEEVSERWAGREMPLARFRFGIAVACGVVGGALVGIFGPWQAAPAAGWAVTAAVYIVWLVPLIRRLSADETARFATREDPSRATADLLLLAANIASLAAVGLVLVKAGNSHATARVIYVATGVASVVLSWLLVHVLFTLHYARLYYSGTAGGIDFNESDRPRYTDFAYLAFTVGMTFQVSDTNIRSKDIRRTVLRHALVSYLFGAVILATAINLVAGLVK